MDVTDKQKSALRMAYGSFYEDYKKETRKRLPGEYQIEWYRRHLKELQSLILEIIPEVEFAEL